MAVELFNFAILYWMVKHKKFEGQVVGLYMFLYGIARYFLEFLRDDPGRGNLFGGAMIGHAIDRHRTGHRRRSALDGALPVRARNARRSARSSVAFNSSPCAPCCILDWMLANFDVENDVLEESPEEEATGETIPATQTCSSEDAGRRLDQYLVANIPDVSRVRVQQLLEEGKILVNGAPAKSSMKLRGTEHIDIVGRAQPAPLKAIAEDIPLDIVFEDRDLAVVNKPAGMLVHAGAGTGDDPRNRGTLVNAMLFRFKNLSDVSGDCAGHRSSSGQGH